jgi:hypothetical protein
MTTSIPDTLIPTIITQTIRQAIVHQVPTIIIRSNTYAPKLSRDVCNITSLAFAGLRPTEFYRVFRASALYASIQLVTTAKYRYQHERAASGVELSPHFKPSYKC